MSWMDICGSICARRYCRTNVVTVCAENLNFIKPAYPNDIVIITSRVIAVGNTSMRVSIKAEIEYQSRAGTDEPAQRVETSNAIFVYVAIDDNGNKVTVPRLQI